MAWLPVRVVDVTAFRALRYDADVAGGPRATSAPAYDALEPTSLAAHRTAGPYTVLQLITADRGGGFGPARETLARWLRTGVLLRDARPAIHLYEQHEVRRGVPAVQRGVLAAVAVADPGVLEHEQVDPERVAARAARLQAVPVDLTPVVALHLGGAPGLAPVVHGAHARPPDVDFEDEAGVTHRLWRLGEPTAVAAVAAAYHGVRVVLADGHHRWAAARAHAAAHPGDPEAARGLAWLVDAADGGPEVRAIHRVVASLPAGAREQVERDFHVAPVAVTALEGALARADGFALGLVAGAGPAAAPAVEAWLLRPRDLDALRGRLPADTDPAVSGLDVAVLDGVVLPALVTGPVTYTPQAEAAAAAVRAGQAAAAFLLRPATVAQVMAVAEAGGRVPPKSTWFRPKPRAGLLLRPALATAAH